MAGKRKRTDKKRIAAIVIAAFLVIVLLLSTFAPFFARAEVMQPVEISTSADSPSSR